MVIGVAEAERQEMSMANDKSTAGVAAAEKFFPAGMDWTKSLETPFRLYGTFSREGFAATARALQLQADFAKKLSECDGPTEILACQSEFARKTLSHCVEDGQRLMEAFKNSPAALSR